MNERIVKNINLDWKFCRGEQSYPGYKGVDDSQWLNVTLPHDWSVAEPFSKEHASGTGYLPGGEGWYRHTFYLDEKLVNKKVCITFDGIYNNSQVWCNSYYIGKRPYGYSAFTYDITPYISFGDTHNVITVRVNHKDIADSRWFTGSGIYRDVKLTITDPIHIEENGVFVTTPMVSEKEAHINIEVNIQNESSLETPVQIVNTLIDAENVVVGMASQTAKIQTDSKQVIHQTVKIECPKMWSTDNPYLYKMRTEVIKDSVVIDNLDIPIGVRSFEFHNQKGFFLNGQNMKLKGLCIHHDAGCLGAAVPQKVWKRRLEKFKDIGCNAIRMSHNPPASNLLDLCDEMGFLVMDEAFDEWEGVKNKWWQGHNVYPPKHCGYYEDFPEWHERDIKAMVLRDRNHPSIICWSIGNEVDYPNDPYCHPHFKSMVGNNDANKPAIENRYDSNKPNAERLTTIAKNLVNYVKECDTSRPVTAALAFPELSNLTGYAAALDIVGYNYKEEFYEEDCRKYPDRVIYGSENGKHLEAWIPVRDRANICGQFLWTGIDFLGEAKGWPIRVSQAGLMDLTGRPKPSYYFRKSLWQDEPMVYLTTRKKQDEPKWDVGDEPHWNYGKGDQVVVYCYSNCEEVELFLNNDSLGIRKLEDCPEHYMMWDTTYESGCISVVGRNNGIECCESALYESGDGDSIKLSADIEKLEATGLDIAHVELDIIDSNNHFVYLADDLIHFHLEGPGEIIGIENGNPADIEAYNTNQRKVFHGKLLLYIRSTLEKGDIKIIATSDQLKSAEITFKAD